MLSVLVALACLAEVSSLMAQSAGGGVQQTLKQGTATVLEVPGPLQPYKVVFEDDGETAYFYALDLSRPADAQIADAIHVYDVPVQADRRRPAS